MLAPRDRLVLAATFWSLAALGLFLLIMLWVHPLRENGLDFQAFYCGAQAISHHASPYLNQPLHDCEASTSPSFFAMFPNVTVPAPLPPYALALFIPFALLPFALAKTFWFGLMLVCTAGVVVLISRLARLPLSIAAAAAGVAILAPTVLQMALAPLPIALLALSAFFCAQKRWNAAAVAMTAAMIEPHVALPAALALFLFIPALRVRLALGALALAIMSLALVGPQTLFWYFTVLLPGHAGSELNNMGQFSLTTLLFHAGVPGALALRLGSLQYAVMLVFGIFIGRVLSKRFDEPAYLVLAPAACSVIGGAFIHLSEIAVAIPLVCMLAQRTRTHLAWVAMALLAVPWEAVFNWAFFAPFAVLSLAWIVWYRWRPMPVLLMLGSLAILMVNLRLHIVSVQEFFIAHAGSMHIAPVAPDASSDITWAAFNALAPGSSFWWFGKVLTIAALALLLVTMLQIARARTSSQQFKTI
ncbi:MAG: hypothetical protein NVSMB31_05160 [Vulcanimicrobiaceae bacterium]